MIKLFEWFAGIGGFREGFNMAGIPHQVIGISEYDKFAVKSYMAMHGETENYGDINSIVTVPYADVWTYGFPCQDISISGKGEGIKEGTRSGLLFRFEEILKRNIQIDEMPKLLIMENVKNLIGKKNFPDFKRWLEELTKIGYSNYFAVLNTCKYELPQNRERVFCISLKDDIDKGFIFPEELELNLTLQDMLDDEVDKKYYLKEEQYKNLIKNLIERNKWNTNSSGNGMNGNVNTKNIADTITTNKGEGQKILMLGLLDILGNEQVRRVYDPAGLSPTLSTMQGGNQQPKILERMLPLVGRSVGRNPDNPTSRIAGLPTKQMFELNQKGVCNTLTTVQKDNLVLTKDIKIRKLTEKECWRLQGFSDELFAKAAEVCSPSQLYKQAGNSVSTTVVKALATALKEQGYL